LERGGVGVAHGDDHADPRAAVKRGAHALAAPEGRPRRDRVGERLTPRQVEHYVADHVGRRPDPIRIAAAPPRRQADGPGGAEAPTRRSYSRRASLRSSQAMRLNSCPGLRSRNAGWKVGTRQIEWYS